MKALIVVLSMVAASAAFGANIQAMSWGQILSDNSLTTGDDIIFNNGVGLGTTFKESTDRDMCHDGAYIYGGKTLVQVCSGSDNDENCSWVSVKLKTPFTTKYKTLVCSGSDNDENCELVTKTRNQRPSRNVAVYKRSSSSNGNDKYIGKKAYTIPFCSDLSPVPAN